MAFLSAATREILKPMLTADADEAVIAAIKLIPAMRPQGIITRLMAKMGIGGRQDPNHIVKALLQGIQHQHIGQACAFAAVLGIDVINPQLNPKIRDALRVAMTVASLQTARRMRGHASAEIPRRPRRVSQNLRRSKLTNFGMKLYIPDRP
jgi:hypothetical protein